MSQNGLCPICGATVLEMYGCGMDVDRLVCSQRGCEYEKELDTITYIEADGSFTTIDVAKDDE
jgi:hypothetical protein